MNVRQFSAKTTLLSFGLLLAASLSLTASSVSARPNCDQVPLPPACVPRPRPQPASHISAGVGGFYTDDDQYRHAIVATTNGDVHEIFYSPAIGIHDSVIAHYNDRVVGVAGFYTPDDKNRHAIVATANSEIHEIYYNPQIGIHDSVIARHSNVVSVAGFFTPDDNNRHAIVTTSDGTVYEVYYNPQIGIHEAVIARY